MQIKAGQSEMIKTYANESVASGQESSSSHVSKPQQSMQRASSEYMQKHINITRRIRKDSAMKSAPNLAEQE